MNVAFGSLSEFFAMGGYAFYVWFAVAFTVLPLVLLVVHTMWQRKALLADVRRQQGRERRIKDAQHPSQEVTG